MHLSVVRQTYDRMEAAEIAYEKRDHFLKYIRNQLKLKHIEEDYVRSLMEDVLQSGITLLLTHRYDCANVDEAIVAAMSEAVQEAAREIKGRKEVTDIITFSTTKEGDKEMSRFDRNGGSVSAEQVLLDATEAACTLQDAVEMAEAVRYQYGFDVILNSLIRAGVIKGMWTESAANGVLSAFEAAPPVHKVNVDTCITRVVSTAIASNPDELVQTIRMNLSRSDVMFAALEYVTYAN